MHLCPLILNVSPVGVRSIGIFSSIDCLMIGIWILGLLYSKMPWNTGSNRMRWSLRGTGVLDVRSYCGVLHALWEICFPWRGIWCAKASKRAAFFMWTEEWGKLLTNDNLRIRGIILLDCVAYVGRVGKWWIIFYFILILQMQCGPMFFMLGSFGVYWVMPKKVADLLAGWRNWFGTVLLRGI